MAETTDRPSVLEGLITRAELAAELGVTDRTVRTYEGQGLPVIRRGMLRLYDPERVRAWLRGDKRPRG
jgi:phage terminase Nu1 subunit (DNA packaging protein)